ncbi:MAG: nucleotidyltransferase family protein [Candidatus Heimdallarchaeota archaeon]
MLSKKKILDILEAEIPFIKKAYHVNKIGLFGSYAREEQNETSNVDLLVEFITPISFFTLFKLEDYLSDKLGVKVEIITPGALKELLIPTIMRDVIYVE